MAGYKVRISSYFPQSVILPDKVQRDMRTRQMIIGSELTEREKRQQYDFKTLFYDMFLTDNKKYLVCIGPPLLNLGDPLSISCSDRLLKFSITKLRQGASTMKLVIIRIKIPLSIRNNKLTLKFRFVRFSLTVSYFRRPTLPMEKTELTLATLQKDNPILWIQDWCRWYRRVHAIKRIVIYDNGSKNFIALKHSLSQLEDIEIILVHWPFPFGTVRSYHNQYSQIGSENHCHLLFCPRRTRWLTFLDLDEYLYVEDEKPLMDYLKFKVFPIIDLPSYVMPSIGVMNANRYEKKLSRFFDHVERPPELSWSSIKYICCPKGVWLHYLHFVILNFYWRQVEKLVVRLNSYFGIKVIRIRNQRTVFFYHLKSLSTLWRFKDREYRRYHKQKSGTDPKKKAVPVLDNVLDTRLRDMARNKGLLEESL